MFFTIVPGAPPPGRYTAEFLGAEPTRHVEFGDNIRWDFQVSDGPYAGSVASRFTGTVPRAKTTCGVLLASLLGRDLRVGEQVDATSLIGRHYEILVATTGTGGTRVETVVAITP